MVAKKEYQGAVETKVVEVRFAISGKVAGVNKKVGERVKKGNLLASLDKKILQTELDRQLSDYEKTRADFEIYGLQKGEPQDEVSKYLKTQKQAQLNASVKEVELAKARLDEANLFSPVEGIIIDDSNLVAGVNITPASGSIKIVDTSSFYFEFAIKQEDISFFTQLQKATIKITGIEKELEGITNPVLSDGKGFFVRVSLADDKDLLLGMKGKVDF